MSDKRENPVDQETLPPLPENEEDRDLILFKRWLKGATFEDLAVQARVSTTQIYRISKNKGWKKWSKRRQERKYRRAAAEVDKEALQKETVRTFVEHRGKMGEWIETTIVFPRDAENVFNIFPMSNPNVEILEENFAEGFIRQRTFFEGGWRSPFRRKRSNEEDWL